MPTPRLPATNFNSKSWSRKEALQFAGVSQRQRRGIFVENPPTKNHKPRRSDIIEYAAPDGALENPAAGLQRFRAYGAGTYTSFPCVLAPWRLCVEKCFTLALIPALPHRLFAVFAPWAGWAGK